MAGAGAVGGVRPASSTGSGRCGAGPPYAPMSKADSENGVGLRVVQAHLDLHDLVLVTDDLVTHGLRDLFLELYEHFCELMFREMLASHGLPVA